MPYLNLEQFRKRSDMPGADLDLLEAQFPGYIELKLEEHESYIDSRLRKRYAAPFSEPVPPIVLRWLHRLVTIDCYDKRGANPDDPTVQAIRAKADKASDELKEAADSKDGLFDLPLRADTTESGIEKGTTLGYSEASPYEWTDVQADAVRCGGNGNVE